MKTATRLAQSQLNELVESSQPTAGMYVRVHGDHLILGRPQVTPRATDNKRMTACVSLV